VTTTWGSDFCQDFAKASQLEWLETNGLGGYASGTVSGVRSRSYHALLVAAREVPLQRVVLLSALEDTLVVRGKKTPLSTNQYRDNVNPQGYKWLEQFRLEPFPTFVYRIGDLRVEKQIFMVHGQPTTWVRYRLLTPANEEIRLTVRPLISFRDLHLRGRDHYFVNTHHDLEEHVIRFLPDRNIPGLHVYHNAVSYEHTALWYQNFLYPAEQERGLACEEDLFTPGVMTFRLSSNAYSYLCATTATLEHADPLAAAQEEIKRRTALIPEAVSGDAWRSGLAAAADHFLVRRADGWSIMAGYPWLSENGRDSMLALPGLLLTTGRLAQARQILQGFAEFLENGLLPSHFPEDQSRPWYNTLDTALWFVLALHAYWQASRDDDFIRDQAWPAVRQILERYLQTEPEKFALTAAGLLEIKEDSGMRTWMDAQVGEWVVTPRTGRPVELNALWYNAICVAERFAELAGEAAWKERLSALSPKIKKSFVKEFYDPEAKACFDVVEDYYQDRAIRPNQLLAIALPFALLTKEQSQGVLRQIAKHLLTPIGLRTLSPESPEYKGRYSGDLLRREGAMYQGTVWPWWMRFYLEAMVKVGQAAEAAKIRRELKQTLGNLHANNPLAVFTEMADGDAPHTLRGCPAKAITLAAWLEIFSMPLAD
jgi:predicted glycogen debranching enzyme